MTNIELQQSLPKTRPRVHATLLTLAALVGVICLYFWKSLVAGQVLSPADLIFQFPFFADAAPNGYHHAGNPALTDPVLKFYPWQLAVRDALARGGFPFWNPFIFGGTPLFANSESAVLYPINILSYAIPPQQALVFTAMVRLAIAGVGMFLFARSLTLARFGALLAAVAFMFGGSMTVWLNYPVSNVYALLPLLFYLAEYLLRGQYQFSIVAFSVVLTAQILGGHVQTVFIGLLALALYTALRLLFAVRSGIPTQRVIHLALVICGAVLLGVLLAAVQLLPFMEWLQQGNELQLRAQERSGALVDASFWKNIVGLVTFVLPNIFGNPTWGVRY